MCAICLREGRPFKTTTIAMENLGTVFAIGVTLDSGCLVRPLLSCGELFGTFTFGPRGTRKMEHDVDIHEATCRECGSRFLCCDPICDGYHVCEDCLLPLTIEDFERIYNERP